MLTPSPLSSDQAVKIIKALVYSFVSGFVGGFALAFTGVLTNAVNGGHVDLNRSFAVGLLVAGMVGGVNTLAVTVKQLFTDPTTSA